MDITALLNIISHKTGLIFLQLLLQSCVLLIPVCTGKIIDFLALNDFTGVFVMAASIAAITFLSISADFLYKKLSIKVIYKFNADLKILIMNAVQSLKQGDYEKKDYGYWMSKIERDAFVIFIFLDDILETVIPGLIIFIFLSAYCAVKNPAVLLVLIPVLVINALVCAKSSAVLLKSSKRERETTEKEYSQLLNIFSMMSILKAFNVTDIYKKKTENTIRRAARRHINFRSKSNLFSSCISANLELSGFIILLLCIYLHINDYITIGGIIVYQALMTKCADAASRAVYLYPSFQNAEEAYKSLKPLLSGSSSGSLENIPDIPEIDGSISFQNVSFSYSVNQELLKNIDLDIKAKEHIVFIGKNGSGKSTISKLILGYFEQNESIIQIGGYRPLEIQAQKKYCHIGAVPQKITLYEDTLLENIRLNDKSISEETVYNFLKEKNLLRFFKDRTLHSIVKPNSLSGGQMQIIGIARALVKNPKILILDEITNNLDIRAKENIINLISQEKNKRTIISITHDIEYTKLADRIYTIENGSVQPV